VAIFELKTPVAFIIFNRPDATAKVFDEITKARPPKLLVIGDGPRVSRLGEAERVAAARAIIQMVDWPCEVLCNYSEVNLGCKARVSSGLDWVFQQVPEAIILEDDCVPDETFFQFCEEMLERYRSDECVGMISGDNFQFGQTYTEDSYYFSRYTHIWGWATWQDRWVDHYDVNMTKWPKIRDTGELRSFIDDKKEATMWTAIFEKVYQGKIDTWDYQWLLANWTGNRLCILPRVNLISNIGFNADATHTIGVSDLANLPRLPLSFPLKHPKIVERNEIADILTKKHCFINSPWRKVMGRARLLLKLTFSRA
jgi:hypothetical protein